MSTSTTPDFVVAVVGNPNTGKSTLFSDLAGVRQRIGNYPGVTVEKKTGRFALAGRVFELIDLPGTYSLAPRSPDEMVAVDVLLGRRDDVPRVDAILLIADASNLERNLYLASQVLELGRPTVLALNMCDVARRRGIVIDAKLLAEKLGVPVVETEAHRRVGVDELRQAMLRLSQAAVAEQASPDSPFPIEFQQETARVASELAGMETKSTAPQVDGNGSLPRYLVERLLLDSSGYLQRAIFGPQSERVGAVLDGARRRLNQLGQGPPAIEAVSRYAWVARVLQGVVTRPTQRPSTASDRLDAMLTHRLWGTLIFAVIMLCMFSAVFVAATPLMDGIDAAFSTASHAIERAMPEGALRSLLSAGVVAGVGSVAMFLPQIMILFLFIGLLEDCGYMARAAFLMDRLMVRVGLSGKSFIPLLSSFACAVPGIMATRVIENRRDRLTTILIAPLMSCSARLPVYTVLISGFLPAGGLLGGLVQYQALALFSMYLLGMVVAALVAIALKRTLLKGEPPPFVMELPSYKWPSPRLVAQRVVERAWGFLYQAGTLILAIAVIVWALSYYPRNDAAIEAQFGARRAEIESSRRDTGDDELTALNNEIAAARQAQSILGRLGHSIEPAVRPLGWDWRIGCAAIASFPAREVVMSVLGVIYNLGPELDVQSETEQSRLIERLRAAKWDGTDHPVYNAPVALSIMVFFALCAQCASTLAVIRRETNSYRWPVFTFLYMTGLAYCGALITYQVGIRLTHG